MHSVQANILWPKFNYWGMVITKEVEADNPIWRKSVCKPMSEDPNFHASTRIEQQASDKAKKQTQLYKWDRHQKESEGRMAAHNRTTTTTQFHTIRPSTTHMRLECAMCPQLPLSGGQQATFWKYRCGIYDNPAFLTIANVALKPAEVEPLPPEQAPPQ